MRAPGAVNLCSGAARRCSGPSRILAKTRSNGARRQTLRGGDAFRVDDLDHRAGAIEPGIGARGAHGGGVDVGREHAPPQGARGGDGEDAAAGAEIENPRAPLPGARLGCAHGPAHRFAEPVEREQAAAGGAVMAGAERERRLDLDADGASRNAGAVMGAMHDEAAGRDRLEPAQALAHPVPCSAPLEDQRLGRLCTGGRGDERAQRVLVGRGAEMNRDAPACIARIPQIHRDFLGGETLGDEIGNAVRRLFAGFQSCDRARGDARTAPTNR